MKKINNFIYLLTLSIFLFSFGVTKTIAQNDSQQKKNVQKPSNLLVLSDSQNYTLQNASALFEEVLDPSPQTSFLPIKTEQDQIGFTHKKLQQFYSGVKVEFGTITLHSNEGNIKSMSSEYYPIEEEFEVAASISNTQAFNRAIAHTGASSYLWQDRAASQELGYEKPTGELVVLPVFGERETKLKLAYKFEIYTIVPMGGGDLYIDANNGQALFFNNKVRHYDNFGHDGRALATIGNETAPSTEVIVEEFESFVAGSAATRYSGNRTIETTLSGTYSLNDAGRSVYTRNANNLAPVGNSLPYITNYSEFTDNDNNWTAAEYDNADKDNAALDAHWGAMMTYDYWSNVHGRDSYDNGGAQLRSYVHVDNDYDNAFWFLNVMSYGDGSSNGNEGNGYFDALTSIDVASHEIGHAVTEYTANLAYQRESGGMNEGFSDIWGAAVEHFAKGNGSDTNPASSIWLIGDEIDRRSGSAALRSMSNPTSLGQPDTYGGTYWQNPNCGTPTQSNDYCGVHTNSGVLNYWFYLSVAGGSGTNDIGSAFNVAGIGMTKASAISYRLLNVYLSANSTYADARTSGIQAAIDLYGAGGAEEQAITNAWHAVGIGAAYGAPSSYCASASTNTSDEYISRVQLGTIDNTSGAQFYSDFTSISTDLNEGQSYTITVTPTWTGTVYSEGYAVWIDYNDDQDFDDAGELVWSKAASTNTPNSGSFTVPTGTAGTATRMRVSMMYNDVPTACETFTYGEVEDYTVNLGGPGADTQAPSNPTSLAASNITQTTVDLNWNASTDNVGVTGYDVYQGASNLGTVTGTSAQITGLTASTAYTFSVRARDAAGNVSGASNSVNVTTSSSPDTQAPSAPTGLIASNITQTTVDLSWNASTDNVGVTGYDVYQGATNLGTVTGTSDQVTGLTASTSYSFSVRARDADGNVSGASNTVNVTTSSAPDTQAPSTPTSLAVTGVTDTTVDLSWNASSDNVGVTGYDVYQGATNLGTVTGTSSQVTGLTAATAYSFSVRARDAAGNVSGASNTVNTTTTGGGGGGGCIGGIASFPYTESYESGLGAWTQSTADDINWTRDSGGTPSSNTGPSGGAAGSWYMFVEASGNGTGYPNKRAILNSPCYDLSSEIAANFSFSYHMYGASDMGSIALEASDDDGSSWTSLWSQTGNKGNSWLGANIDLSAYLGGSVQLRFNRLTGSTWQADIAIDNVNLSAGGGGNSGCAGGASLPYTESFESSIGAWTQSTADDINWTRDANGTPSSNTGPSGGAAGSWYMFVEASGNGTGYPNKRAILNSPCIDLNGKSSATFNFNYHMYGSSNMGTIDLEVSADDGASWTSIWSQSGNKGNSWLSASVDLTAYVDGGVQLRFNRVTGSTWQADIAIDNISVSGINAFNGGITGGVNNSIINGNSISDAKFSIYPNPVKGSVLNVEVVNTTATDYVIYNMIGQVIRKGTFTTRVDVNLLEAGMYVIEVNTESNKFVERFIKE